MNFKRLKILRVAARVIRCHTTPTIHTQSVGEHTFGALNILYTIDTAPSAQLVRFLLWHDVPEAITGDVPAPAKRYSKVLRAGLGEAEAKIIAEYDLMPDTDLTPKERDKAFYCDLMDLAIFAAEEADFGNAAAPVLMRRALAAISQRGLQGVTPAASDLYALACSKLSRYNMAYAESTMNGWFHYDE